MQAFQVKLATVTILGTALIAGPTKVLGADDLAKAKPATRPDDPAARAFLKEAEEHSPIWSDFPGFSAKVKVYFEGKTHEGQVEVPANRKIKVSLSDPESRKWVLNTLTASLANSFRKPFEERYEGVGVVFGKDDLHPLGMLVELRGDSYKSRFRIRDGEFRVIERSTPEHDISIQVLNIERDEQGRKLSRSFVVSYFNKESGRLEKTEAIREERRMVDRFALPGLWTETDVRREGGGTRSLSLTDHRLLSNGQEKALSTRAR
ncbi:MAG: DUF3386 family protein [Bryobacteraceae bacterium]|nr:DUF3386 family protein [Bryobacteraceae bacterium]